MSKSPFHSQAFKDLENKWYRKLKASGFSDAESKTRSTGWYPLSSWHEHKFRQVPLVQIEACSAYYDWARSLLLCFEFKNRTHRRIWQLHCEGLNKRQIAKRIRKYRREQIGNIINRIKNSKHESDR